MPNDTTEEEIRDCLVDAWNLFQKLDPTHPSDTHEFQHGIHQCQAVMGMRELRRLKPEKYPSFKVK